MGIKRLFFETILMLALIMLIVVTINSYQAHRNAVKNLAYLQEQYLDATFEIYKNQLVGDILVGDKDILVSLLDEITQDRGVGVILHYDDMTLQKEDEIKSSLLQSYTLNLGIKKFASIQLYPLKNIEVFNIVNTLLIPLILEVLVLLVGFLWLLVRIRRKLLNPLQALVLHLKAGKIDTFLPKDATVLELRHLCLTLQAMTDDLLKKAQYEAEAVAAKQVAHDIRSPLACLNLLLSYASALPEKQRILMRSTIQDITDIANGLQKKATESALLVEDRSCSGVVMLSSLLEGLVSEKRMQLELGSQVAINLNLDRAYGLFSTINATELKRVLSNLINNSLEAFDSNPHQIYISVCSEQEQVVICIKDDGKGIPQNILKKVGAYGFSYGKENLVSAGSGLGVHHAQKTIETFDGGLVIESRVNQGTSVTIRLPQAAQPKWFVSRVSLSGIKLVVVVDDVESIHDLWRDKLDNNKAGHNFAVKHFAALDEFKDFVLNDFTFSKNEVLFLVDYEFVGQSGNGLDAIEELNLQGQAILVTSHHGDYEVLAKAMNLRVGIIPKGVVSYVPVG